MTRDPRALRGAWQRHQVHDHQAPAPDLAPVVAHFWTVTWRYEQPYRQLIVPYPQVHLTFRTDDHAGDVTATVSGVASRHVARVLEGRGRVVGVAFRPGCFRPFLGRSVSTLTDQTVPAAEVFGPDVDDVRSGGDVQVHAVEEFLRARLPDPDPRAQEVAAIVEQVAASPSVMRVDALAGDVGLGVRQLQRLFSEYVGVGPKWVIRRYRLHEVTESLAAGGGAVDWSALAADLGYADQAHFVRDFTAMVGETPTQYALRY